METAVRAQRRRFSARHVSRARRRRRDLSELSGSGVSHRAVGRRDRCDFTTIDPLLGESRSTSTTRVADLSEDALRDVASPRSSARSKPSRKSSSGGSRSSIDEGKMVEAQRLHQRTMFDLEMIKEMGFCRGIENYSRHLTGQEAGRAAADAARLSAARHDDGHRRDRTRRCRRFAACIEGDQSRKANTGRISDSVCRRRWTIVR